MVEKWVWMGVAGVIVGYVAFANMSVPTNTYTSTGGATHQTAPLSMQNKQGEAAKRIVHDQRMQFGGQGQTEFRFEEGRKLYISIKNTGRDPYDTSSTVRMDQTCKAQRAAFLAERYSRENATICCLSSQRGRMRLQMAP
ncbi:hypothetical protein MF625_000135 [Paenibacillus polymyxa]|uniref:hypothetical protein n=1 Tax=Paenibacillus polymyxa TaxID=1406 RepID=UPI002025A5B5|nr:hypothetical protein [Paenibacillus polymyxa]URJ35788.3 hypothetical protein MF625_000135 [Paenibacillus polymyxa]